MSPIDVGIRVVLIFAVLWAGVLLVEDLRS